MNDVAVEAVFVATRLFIGAVLAMAVVGKLRDFPSFVLAVRGFRIVSRQRERPLAFVVVVTEIVAVLFLVLREWAVVGLGLAVILLGAFTVAMASVLARGDRVMCGCFGSSTVPIGGMHILRNSVILMVGVGGIVASVTSDGRPLDADLLGVVSASAILSAALLVLADQVLAIPHPVAVPTNRRAGATFAPRIVTTKVPPGNPPNRTPTER